MKTTTKALLVLLTLTASACTRPDRFGADGAPDGASNGANAAAEAATGANDPTSPEFFAQSVGDRVLFAVDSATISPEGQATLQGQAQWLIANADYLAIIEGHADEQGTREYNLALGARRANAAREFLISQGVAQERLRTISYGKERPIEICAEEACYAQNRRAVTILSIGATS